jgi:hypothetical protein
MNQLTDQQIFDRVAKHLLKQGRRAQYDNDSQFFCAYLNTDGFRCAVGCLFKNDEWTNAIAIKLGGSTKRIYADGQLQTLLDFDLAHEQVELLSALQVIHDRHEPGDWKRALRNFAEKHKLNDDVLLDEVAS